MDRPAGVYTRELLRHRLQVGSGRSVATPGWLDAAGIDAGSRDVEDQPGWKVGAGHCADGGIDPHQPGADGGSEGGAVGAGWTVCASHGITLH